MRIAEACYEDGVLRPEGRLALRAGERVNPIVVRRADAKRWDLTRLATASGAEGLTLAEQGLTEWAKDLDAGERS